MKKDAEDGFLDGRVCIRQPARGFRSGLDAVMVAAAVPAKSGDTVLELGTGSGVASLCLAARVPGCAITAVELDSSLVALAKENAAASGLESRVRIVEADALRLPPALRGEFDRVFCNPPFHGEPGQRPPMASRARATHDRGQLGAWLRAGVKRVRSGGTLTVILRADRIGEVLAVLPPGGVSIFPLWPKAGEPAKRIIVQVRKDSRRPLELLSGLTLHDSHGRYTPEAEGILRGGAALSIDSSGRPPA